MYKRYRTSGPKAQPILVPCQNYLLDPRARPIHENPEKPQLTCPGLARHQQNVIQCRPEHHRGRVRFGLVQLTLYKIGQLDGHTAALIIRELKILTLCTRMRLSAIRWRVRQPYSCDCAMVCKYIVSAPAVRRIEFRPFCTWLGNRDNGQPTIGTPAHGDGMTPSMT
jgi:hypothetical protein